MVHPGGGGGLVGRDRELTAVLAVLDAAAAGHPGGARVVGEPGAGKTTLLATVIDAAASRGFTVLRTTAVESETELAFVGLADVLGDVTGADLDPLDAVPRRALETALLRRDVESEPADARAIGAAVRDILARRAGIGPLLLVVDDEPWLDEASGRALRFALRRLGSAPVAVVVTRRTGYVAGDSLGDALGSTAAEVSLDGLTADECDTLLRERAGIRLARPQLVRVAELTGGNPLLLVELARSGALADPEQIADLDRLPLAERITRAVTDRFGALPVAARRVLTAAALCRQPTAALLDAVLPADVLADGLPAAIHAGLLGRSGDALHLSHPLVRTAVLGLSPPAEVRDVHAAFASAVADRIDRARHAALAITTADEGVAAELEAAATEALLRGAPTAAADLAAHAVRLTPADRGEERARRLLWLGELRFLAGDAHGAQRTLEPALATLTGGLRVEALRLLARAVAETSNADAAIALYEQALAEADRPAQADIHRELAAVRRWVEDGPGAAIDHAQTALTIAGDLDDPLLELRCIGTATMLLYNSNHAVDPALLERGIHLERELGQQTGMDSPRLAGAFVNLWAGHVSLASALADESLRAAGPEASTRVLDALYMRACCDWVGGRLDDAATGSSRVLQLASQFGWDAVAGFQRLAGWIAARAGALDEAERLVEQAQQTALTSSAQGWLPGIVATRGFIELSRDDVAAAAVAFDEAVHLGLPEPLVRPGTVWWLADYVEALVRTGRHDEAQDVLAQLTTALEKLGYPSLAVRAARSDALIRAATGDVDGAIGVLDPWRSTLARSEEPFELGRNDLLLGELLRRRKRKADARDAIESARGIFASMGARAWTARAERELARVGAAPVGVAMLTATEQAIAGRAAAGRTNREIADSLHLSPKTVEWNLSRVYAKLGVRSRTELAARFAELPGASG